MPKYNSAQDSCVQNSDFEGVYVFLDTVVTE